MEVCSLLYNVLENKTDLMPFNGTFSPLEDICLWEETWRKRLIDLHHGEYFAAW